MNKLKNKNKILVGIWILELTILTGASTFKTGSGRPVTGDQNSKVSQQAVLGISTTDFNVNIPAIFSNTVTFTKDVAIPNIVNKITGGKGTDIPTNQNPTISNMGVTSLNTSKGSLSLIPGTGISISGLTITNTDPGSAQNIFKNIAVSGQDTVTAGNNSDTLTLVGETGITITTNSGNKKITFSADPLALNVSGWSETDGLVTQTSPGDLVGIGTANPAYNLDIAGTKNVSGNATFGELSVYGPTTTFGGLNTNGNTTLGTSSTNTISFLGRLSTGTGIYPLHDLGANLGTADLRFNNIYVANFNSNSGLTTNGQATFTYSPTDTSFSQSTVALDPASAPAGSWLLGVGVGNYQKAGVDSAGNLVLGYNGAISAPAAPNPLTIYGHNETIVTNIDTSGNLETTGGININGTNSAVSGTLNVNTITSSGSLTISPTSNLNVALADGSQFSVNTNKLTVDGTTGRVGIGTTNAQANLDVAVAAAIDGIVLTNSGSKVLGLSYGANSANINVLSANPTNTITNGGFEADLIGWSGSQRYSLDDEFSDTLPQTLATSSAVLQSGGVSNPTPQQTGNELAVNGDMETGIPNSWLTYSVTSPPTLTSVTDERTGGTGTYSLDNYANSGNSQAYQRLCSFGNWCVFTVWGKNIVGSKGYLNLQNSSNPYQWLGSSAYFGSTWSSRTITARAVGTTINVQLISTYAGDETRFDDLSVKQLNLPSLFSTVNVANTNSDYSVQADTTVTSRTQGGIVMNLDNPTTPNNFIIAYHDGTNMHLEKDVAGTYTSLINTAKTYVPGATIKIVKNGVNYSLYYNGSQVGTTQVISDAGIINNTYHGVFSTYASNSFANFKVTSLVTSPTPTIGSELNGDVNFANSSYWGKDTGWTVSNGANASNVAAFSMVYKSIATTGTWYQMQYTIATVSAGSLNVVPNVTGIASQISQGSFSGTGRATNLTVGAIAGSSGTTGTVSSLSIKPITLSSIFSTTTVAASTDHTVQADVTVTSGTQAGVVLNMDSSTTPTKFVIGYIDGSKAYLEKNVNGTYTTVIAGTAITYVAGQTLKVIQNGTSYSLFYNGTQVGTTQSISDVPTTNIHGVFSTYASNSFANFSVKGGINGTLATDGVNTRNVIDSLSKLSLANGSLSSSGTGPIMYYGAQPRTAGKVLYGKITPQGNSGTYANFGWTGSANSNALYYGYVYRMANDRLYFYNNSGGGGTVTELGPAVVSGTTYQDAIIFANGGMYEFIKGGIYTNWSLIWKSTDTYSGTTHPVWGHGPNDTDKMYIPSASFLPTPLAYDTFTRADGALGTSETTGPDGQTTPALSWTGSTWAISSNAAINTPNLGSEVASNGDMETGIPPTNWSASNANLTSVADPRTGSSGTQSISVVNSSNNYGAATQTTNLSIGSWVRVSGYAKAVVGVGNAATIQIQNTTTLDTRAINSSWTLLNATGRVTSNNPNIILTNGYANSGNESRFDDISVKQISLSSLFSSVSTSTSDVIADVDITRESAYSDTQAGIVINLDSTSNPQNFILAYIDGNESYANGRLKVKLEKVVAGVYTTLINVGSITYSPGATLRVIKDGTKYRVYYNNVMIGSEQTITDTSIINNTKHGLFSTYAGNSFDNFTIFPRGTGNEYAQLTPDPLTVTRDTTIKYDGSAASAKLVAGTTDNDFTEAVNVGNTNTYTLTAFAYTNGSAVSASDLSLYYGSAPIATNYQSQGGSGWYKLTGTFTGIANSQPAGVRVKAGKTVYVDNINLATGAGASTTLYVADSGTGMAGLDVQGTSTLHSGTAGERSLVVSGVLGQTADLTDWLNSNNSVLAYVNSNGLLNASAGGLATYVKAGTVSDTDIPSAPNGTFAIDSTNGRIYFKNGGVWSYAAKSGGFQIPLGETQNLEVGDYLIPYVESIMDDGAVHGLYLKWNDIKNTLFAGEDARITALEQKSATISSSLSLSESSNLNVLGTATLGNVSLSGQLSINNFQFSDSGTIQELNGNALKIQSLALGDINFANGGLTITTNGDVNIPGLIYGNGQTRGEETLPTGVTSITIVKNWTKTPKTILVSGSFDAEIWVSDLSEKGFSINSGNTSNKDEKIDWQAIW